jgi:hypothetical protein
MQEAIERNIEYRQSHVTTLPYYLPKRDTNLFALAAGLLVKVVEQLDEGDLLTESVLHEEYEMSQDTTERSNVNGLPSA